MNETKKRLGWDEECKADEFPCSGVKGCVNQVYDDGDLCCECEGNRSLHSAVLSIAEEMYAERLRQRELYPDSEHLPDGTGGGGRETWERIARLGCDRADREGRLTHTEVFDEETAEVMAATDPVELRKELVQVGAVVCKWIADIDSRVAKGSPDLAAAPGRRP